MNGHPIPWVLGMLASIATALVAALATRVRLLPEVIDISIIPTIAGLGALSLTTYGALRRYDHDRVARLTLAGTVLGTFAGVGLFLVALLIQVL
jgi:hypothetical protein